MFRRLDDILLDRAFQPLVNAWRRDPLGMAQSAAVGSAVFGLGFAGLGPLLEFPANLAWVAPLLAAAILWNCLRAHQLFHRARRWRQDGAASPLRLHYLPLRLLHVVTLMLVLGYALAPGSDVIDVFALATVALSAASHYLACCQAPPPRRQESFATLRPAPVPRGR